MEEMFVFASVGDIVELSLWYGNLSLNRLTRRLEDGLR